MYIPLSRRRYVSHLSHDSTDGRLVYAIGDIHGRHDLLVRLIKLIAQDALHSHMNVPPLIVFLGDYVDRGPGSRLVLEYICALRSAVGFDVRCLLGNHEQTLLEFLRDGQIGPQWLKFGGGATLESYGVAVPPHRAGAELWQAAASELSEKLPASHIQLLKALQLTFVCGDYVFVHAGVRPGVPLEEQAEEDLLWSRAQLVSDRRPFEKIVVHGHTPVEAGYLSAQRIAIDTGAYATGILTAVRLQGVEQSLISTQRAPL